MQLTFNNLKILLEGSFSGIDWLIGVNPHISVGGTTGIEQGIDLIPRYVWDPQGRE